MTKFLRLIVLIGLQLVLNSEALTPEQEANRSKLVPIKVRTNLRAVKDYYFSTFELSWYDAQSYCNDSDLKLLTDDTPIEHNTIIQVLDQSEGFEGHIGDAWIGGRFYPIDSTWWWNPTAGVQSKMIWYNFVTDTCDAAPPTSGCTTLSNELDTYGQWKAKPCNELHKFFCEARDN